MKRLWLIAVCLAIIWFATAVYIANAHDAYTGLKNAQGIQCCGGKDCAPYDGPAKQIRGGWLVDGEFVSDDRTLPSFDVNFHRCYWDNQTKCFLVPGSS